MLACGNSDGTSTEQTVELLLNNPNIDVNAQNKKGMTALMLACMHSGSESTVRTVEMLLNHSKINVNMHGEYGRTALMFANSKRTIELLLNHPEIDVNAKDEFGNTVLMNKASNDNTDTYPIELLLKHPKINVNIQNKHRMTALIMACYWREKNLSGIVETLLKHPGINLNLQDDEGYSALMRACMSSAGDRINAIKKLLYYGANYNLTNNDGWTTQRIMCGQPSLLFESVPQQRLKDWTTLLLKLSDRRKKILNYN